MVKERRIRATGPLARRARLEARAKRFMWRRFCSFVESLEREERGEEEEGEEHVDGDDPGDAEEAEGGEEDEGGEEACLIPHPAGDELKGHENEEEGGKGVGEAEGPF